MKIKHVVSLQTVGWNSVLLEASPTLVAFKVLSGIKDVHLGVRGRVSILPTSWAEGLRSTSIVLWPLGLIRCRCHTMFHTEMKKSHTPLGCPHKETLKECCLDPRLPRILSQINKKQSMKLILQVSEFFPCCPSPLLYLLSHKITSWKIYAWLLSHHTQPGKAFPVNSTISNPFGVPNLNRHCSKCLMGSNPDSGHI